MLCSWRPLSQMMGTPNFAEQLPHPTGHFAAILDVSFRSKQCTRS